MYHVTMTDATKVVKLRAMTIRMDFGLWKKFRAKIDRERRAVTDPSALLPSAQSVITDLVSGWVER